MNGPAPAIPDDELVAAARRAGFWGENLLTFVATVFGESGADPDNIGDESLVTTVWGPSVGLAQIRSLWADRGTGRTRDAERLDEVDFNLRSAFAISSGGTNFTPWTVFTSGDYRKYLKRAAAAIAGTPFNGVEGAAPIAGSSSSGGGGLVDKVTDPLVKGLSRVVLVGVLLAGGVGLVTAGGWKAVAR